MSRGNVWGWASARALGLLVTAAGSGFDASIAEWGNLLLPSALGSSPVGFTTARLVRSFGARLVIMSGLLASALAFAGMALWHDSTWQWYAATTLQGLDSGLVFSSLAGVEIASVPADQTGVASGMNANIRPSSSPRGSARVGSRWRAAARSASGCWPSSPWRPWAPRR